MLSQVARAIELLLYRHKHRRGHYHLYWNIIVAKQLLASHCRHVELWVRYISEVCRYWRVSYLSSQIHYGCHWCSSLSHSCNVTISWCLILYEAKLQLMSQQIIAIHIDIRQLLAHSTCLDKYMNDIECTDQFNLLMFSGKSPTPPYLHILY